ncbi:MAG: serine/threonine-protein kinase [Myxococcales bacterium]
METHSVPPAADEVHVVRRRPSVNPKPSAKAAPATGHEAGEKHVARAKRKAAKRRASDAPDDSHVSVHELTVDAPHEPTAVPATSTWPPQPSPLGSVIGGRYRIERPLGEGGVGTVYEATHIHLHKRVAVKVLRPEMAEQGHIVARFEREAIAASRVEHPNIAAATDFGRLDDGSFFLVLEFVDGTNLRDALAGAAFPFRRALHVILQIASGIARAHFVGVVHRDLKPENIMLIERDGDPDFVKILDFGIAKLLDDVPVSTMTMGAAVTQAGTIFGTPEYMAPEQALGQAPGVHSDLYSLGVLAFELFTGQRPFQADSHVDLLSLQLTQAVPAMADFQTAVPPGVEDAVQRLLSPDVSERFASALDFIEALQVAMASPPSTSERITEPPEAPYRSGRFPRALSSEELLAVRTLPADASLSTLVPELSDWGTLAMSIPPSAPPPMRSLRSLRSAVSICKDDAPATRLDASEATWILQCDVPDGAKELEPAAQYDESDEPAVDLSGLPDDLLAILAGGAPEAPEAQVAQSELTEGETADQPAAEFRSLEEAIEPEQPYCEVPEERGPAFLESQPKVAHGMPPLELQSSASSEPDLSDVPADLLAIFDSVAPAGRADTGAPMSFLSLAPPSGSAMFDGTEDLLGVLDDPSPPSVSVETSEGTSEKAEKADAPRTAVPSKAPPKRPRRSVSAWLGSLAESTVQPTSRQIALVAAIGVGMFAASAYLAIARADLPVEESHGESEEHGASHAP